ncbi:hypothetical protein ACEWY4_020962 [Coilia grayii]|uniref:Tight junction-associated protein 1 domain-containing protein n=1 Tax=Coilia grayii TaxID=363190 RepID=A0ABD1J7Z8_9TELE
MTSAGPARKPYRKAPPQHRETRHGLPVFREDLPVSPGLPPTGLVPPGPPPGPPPPPSSAAQSEPCQVICLRNHTLPVLQRTRFADQYPVKRAASPDGTSVFSSSWSLASDSELDVSSLSSLDVTVLPPPRIFSHGTVAVTLPPRSRPPAMSRFLSRSEDLLALSPEDEPATSESSQLCVLGGLPARSPERSLVFKETAEILAPRGKRPQRESGPQGRPLPFPPKGILKTVPPSRSLPAADGLRKAKSVEVLGQSRGRCHKPKSTSLDRELGGSRRGKNNSSAGSVSPADWRTQLLEQKIKFSQFLDEITYRVLSPANLHLLGGKKPEPACVGQNPKQNPGPVSEQKDRKSEKRPWDNWVAQHQATRRDREREKEQHNRPKVLNAPTKDSPHRELEKWRADVEREGARPKSEGSFGGGHSRRTSESDWEDRSHRGNQQQHHSSQSHHQHQHKHKHHHHHTPHPYQQSPQQPHTQPHLTQHSASKSDFRTQSKDAAEKSPPLPPKLGSAGFHAEGLKASVSQHSSLSFLSQLKESLSDSDKIKILQQQNEDLRRRLTQTTHKMEAMETEFEASRHYMQAEMGRTRDDLDKMRDKFRRLQNSYTASQRANQELEEKLHALLRKVERDKKTMDQEIVELTNKLLDAKNTIDKLEELNERYRQDCNLAVQLLKCNKSHFRNHKFADLPSELQEMVNKHMKSSLPERAQGGGQAGAGAGAAGGAAQSQDPDTLSLTPADVVPTSVIARVLEKPEPLVLNSAQSSSGAGRPVAEDVFVHVDMTGPGDNGGGGGGAGGGGGGYENGGPGHAGRPPQAAAGSATEAQHLNGSCRRQGSLEGPTGEEQGAAVFEKLNPYPAPAPPAHALYPGRKVIEFSSDDKVKIPKNSPLPNCTYATRQAISLSLVQSEEEAAGERQQRPSPGSPAVSEGGWRSGSGASSSSGGGSGSHRSHQRHRQALTPPHTDATDPPSSQSSPFSSPPQPPSAFASSGSSEEDLLANWQRMFVEKMAPSSEGTLVNRTAFSSETAGELQRRGRHAQALGAHGPGSGASRGAYSDGEEGSSTRSWTASRESSLDTDTGSLADLRSRRGRYGGDFSQEEGERLLVSLDPLDGDDGASGDTAVTLETGPVLAEHDDEYLDDAVSAASSAEERDVLPQDFPVISPRVLAGLEDYDDLPPPPPPPPPHHAQTGSLAVSPAPTRPQKSPKRMGVHHLHRKDSLTRAQEHGNLLD